MAIEYTNRPSVTFKATRQYVLLGLADIFKPAVLAAGENMLALDCESMDESDRHQFLMALNDEFKPVKDISMIPTTGYLIIELHED